MSLPASDISNTALVAVSVDPEIGFYPGAQDVQYTESLAGELFFWKEMLVRVIRKNGGANQVCVELESKRGLEFGFPQVKCLFRAVPLSATNTDPIFRFPTKPFNLAQPNDVLDLQSLLENLLVVIKRHTTATEPAPEPAPPLDGETNEDDGIKEV